MAAASSPTARERHAGSEGVMQKRSAHRTIQLCVQPPYSHATISKSADELSPYQSGTYAIAAVRRASRVVKDGDLLSGNGSVQEDDVLQV